MTKELIGKLVTSNDTGFGQKAYLIDFGKGMLLWVSESNLDNYNVIKVH